MKMQFKPILWLVAGIVVMFTVSLVMELYRNTTMLQKLSRDNLALLEQRELKNADNVFLTIENAVKGSLERGEMGNSSGSLKRSAASKGSLNSRCSTAIGSSRTLPMPPSSTKNCRLTCAPLSREFRTVRPAQQ